MKTKLPRIDIYLYVAYNFKTKESHYKYYLVFGKVFKVSSGINDDIESLKQANLIVLKEAISRVRTASEIHVHCSYNLRWDKMWSSNYSKLMAEITNRVLSSNSLISFNSSISDKRIKEIQDRELIEYLKRTGQFEKFKQDYSTDFGYLFCDNSDDDRFTKN